MRRNINMIVFIVFIHALQVHADDAALIATLTRYVPVSPTTQQAINHLKTTEQQPKKPISLTKQEAKWTLYNYFPGLKKTLPRVVLCNLPTPVKELKACGKELGISLFMKDDGCSALPRHMGGNKPRKLEPILAHAKQLGATTIVTFGCIGSNHAAATADCAQRQGLGCILELKPQTPSHIVRRNLLLMHHFGAQMNFYASHALRDVGVANSFLQVKRETGTFPYVIPTGAETALGAVGFVNAAFELKDQIKEKKMPEPDYIYVATGGFGHPQGLLGATLAGLVVGLKAAGLKTHVVGVFTEPNKKGLIEDKLLQQCRETVELLHAADPKFPVLTVTPADYTIEYDCAAPGYGVYNKEGMAALQLMKSTENIKLDGTYTGKAFSCLIRDARARKLAGKTVLFWNTFCADEFNELINYSDYSKLPQPLHKYFVGKTQPLDAD